MQYLFHSGTPPMDELHLSFPWSQVVTAALTIAFALWAWVIKKFGESHVESLKELSQELREMRHDINALYVRIAVVESKVAPQ